MKRILIPHLAYTVNVKEPGKNKPITNAVAWVEWDSDNECSLYIKQPIKPYQVPTLAHELVHVLQHISEARGIHFASEREHLGYLMQWLMNEVLGYSYYAK